MSLNKSKKTRLMELQEENASGRLSFARKSIGKARTSTVPRYSIDTNNNPRDTQVDEGDQNDALVDNVLGCSWTVCRVSPLHNLNYATAKLEQYATIITKSLKNNLKDSESTKYKTDLRTIENLKTDTVHQDALQISVYSVSCDNEKMVFNSIFLSWGCFTDEKKNNVTYLPLMFHNGNAKICSLVKETLRKLFDCVITQMKFNQPEMLLMGALLSNFANKSLQSGGKDSVTFTFNVPFITSPTNFQVTLNANDLHYMWLSRFPNRTEISVLNEEISSEWYSEFGKYIGFVFEIDITKLELLNIEFPKIMIHSKGEVKMRECEISKYVLSLCCEKAVILKSTKPTLADAFY